MKHLLTPIILLMALACGCTDYNYDKPDTPANKKGFARHLGQKPPADVKGVYFYADEMGADRSYQFRFLCSPETLDSLVQSLSMTNTTKVQGHLRGRDFPWWDPGAVDGLPVHWKTNSVNGRARYYWFLWYDRSKSEAFWLEYSI